MRARIRGGVAAAAVARTTTTYRPTRIGWRRCNDRGLTAAKCTGGGIPEVGQRQATRATCRRRTPHIDLTPTDRGQGRLLSNDGLLTGNRRFSGRGENVRVSR